ncbi:ATP-binding protein [Iodobacter sp. HSC-16F04]|uniref:ATP-binding protein n=1 Tax=Iodobacter violaceini TaxID=3044271 RepID=A0ABX0KLG9_9NEIS|nr:AAA family ATPase [Iodobacter violacea]NHQ85040.1 ATP-binding protein [Iodobacter violacea]
MEAIIFVGIQASGKSTFYKNNFFNSHIRISNDLLKTKNREKLLLDLCKETKMPFVLDNTNVSKDIRSRYIQLIKAMNFTIKCYYFKPDISRSLEWNENRSGKENIPKAGILGTYKRLECPESAEGFDKIFYVDFTQGKFLCKEWCDEI